MMGMMPPNKKIASIILGGPKPGNETEGDEVPKEDDVAMDSVATKIMSAIESKDKKALIEGLKDFMDIIESEDEDHEMPGPEGME